MAGAPPSLVSTAASPWLSTLTRVATPRPSATTMATEGQPATTWRAVIQTPLSAMEKAVPLLG
ncbi:MAG: hypothetical protein K0R83_1793 [Caulobacter sp.]|nr:hypothetical protein [Caulobacter sp.]